MIILINENTRSCPKTSTSYKTNKKNTYIKYFGYFGFRNKLGKFTQSILI